MLSVAYFNSTTGFSAKFMKMLIRKVSVEFNFVEVVLFVFGVDGLSGYGAESMVMAIATFIENFGAFE